MSPANAAFLTASGNAGVTFETQGRCENEACPEYGASSRRATGSSAGADRTDTDRPAEAGESHRATESRGALTGVFGAESVWLVHRRS